MWQSGLDDLTTARSVHEMHEAELAWEDHYTDVLKHMLSRLMMKRQHYEKRLVHLRTSLILVNEDDRVYNAKMQDALAAESRMQLKLEKVTRDREAQLKAHHSQKSMMVERLRNKSPARTPSPDEMEMEDVPARVSATTCEQDTSQRDIHTAVQ